MGLLSLAPSKSVNTLCVYASGSVRSGKKCFVVVAGRLLMSKCLPFIQQLPMFGISECDCSFDPDRVDMLLLTVYILIASATTQKVVSFYGMDVTALSLYLWQCMMKVLKIQFGHITNRIALRDTIKENKIIRSTTTLPPTKKIEKIEKEKKNYRIASLNLRANEVVDMDVSNRRVIAAS